MDSKLRDIIFLKIDKKLYMKFVLGIKLFLSAVLCLSLNGCILSNASLSREELPDEQVRAIVEGTPYGGLYGKAIIYEENKMLYIFSGTSGCAEMPSKVKVSGNTLKIFYTYDAKSDKACSLAMTGPFGVVVNIPDGFSENKNARVTGIRDGREEEIPVFRK